MKSKSKSLLSITIAASALAAAASSQAANLTWNNGAGTSSWNTTDANWSGSTWNNSNPDNATFNSISGTINLGEAITAGSVNFYWNGYNGSTRSPVLTGSSLSVGSLSVNGVALGGGVDSIAQAYNERAQISNTTNVSGNVTVQRGMLYLYNGTLNVSGAINSVDAWNVFRADNSTVTATGGINLSSIASAVELYGGTVTTPFIKVGNATWDGSSGLAMGSGVTVVATQSTNDFIQVYNNGDTGSRAAATLTAGGATIDTSTYAVTVATVLNGGGSFTKTGSGTLTLNQSNNYTGGTNVNQGTLVLASGAWTLNNVGGAGVTVGSGATLRADNSVANQLNGLTLNGGTVDAVNSSGNGDWGNYFLTGNVSASGTSNLNADVALRASNVDFSVASGGKLNVGGTLHNGAFFGIYSGAPATVSKSGSGAMEFSGTNTYSGATTVSAGTLFVSGALTNSAVTVGADGTIGSNGGNGSLGNGLTINAGGNLDLTGASLSANSSGILSLSGGNLSLGNLTFQDIVGWDWANASAGTYKLISGDFTIDWGSTAYLSPETAYDFGNGNKGYFTSGSLNLVVIPEPDSALLSGLSLLFLLRRRRR